MSVSSPTPAKRLAAKRSASAAPRDPERTRATILAAATAEFSRHGLGGARVDRIAEKAGVNKRMLYYYYGDKEGLFLAVLEETYANIRSAEAELRLLELDPAEGIRRMVSFTWAYYLEHPEFLTLLNSENLHRARHLKRSRHIRLLNTPTIAILGELLRRGEAAGIFRPGVDPLDLYISIAGVCYFYLSNNHTLATVFDRSVADPARHAVRLAHMEDLVIASLTNRSPDALARINQPVKMDAAAGKPRRRQA